MKKEIRKYVAGILWSLLMAIAVAMTAYGGEEVVCRIGTNYYSSINLAVQAASSGDTIFVLKNCTVNARIDYTDKMLTIKGETDQIVVTRGTGYTGTLFYVYGGSTETTGLTLENITLDGGAAWDDESLTAEAARDRVNTGIVSTSPLLYVKAAVLQLNEGAIIEDCMAVDLNDEMGVAIQLKNGILNMYDGAVIQRCTGARLTQSKSVNYSIVCNYGNGTINMYGGIIQACADLATDANSASAIFMANYSYSGNAVLNMYADARIQENYSVDCSAVLVRAADFNMYGAASVSNNIGENAFGGVLIYTSSNMRMYDSASVKNNVSGKYGGGVSIA